MTVVDDYWSSFEGEIGSIADFVRAAEMIGAYQQATDSRFVWRGASDASWGLHSSLVRAYQRRNRGTVPTEPQLRAFERSVLDEARRWGVDWHTGGGRLTGLEILARLQHFGVPTRMLDFTFSPLVALWFAVEGAPDVDGRLIALDISGRRVSRQQAISPDPWWWRVSPNVTEAWSTQSTVWAPPPLEPRIVRQEGCFLVGGVPSTTPLRNVRTATAWRPMRAAEVRECMSVPFLLITYQQAQAAHEGRALRGGALQKPRPSHCAFETSKRCSSHCDGPLVCPTTVCFPTCLDSRSSAPLGVRATGTKASTRYRCRRSRRAPGPRDV